MPSTWVARLTGVASMRTQLLLDLTPDAPPAFSNFVAGSNAEAIQHLRDIPYSRGYQSLYLWGPPGCGKSHLLAACASVTRPLRHIVLSESSALTPPELIAPGSLIIIDDVHSLSEAAQTTLFRLFNSARHSGLAFVLTARVAPLELNLREDLRTRLGQSLILQLNSLSDEEKRTALQRHALQRGMRLDEVILNYLMNHGRRDLPTLLRFLDQLDQASLEVKRQPTLPLLRELMQSPS